MLRINFTIINRIEDKYLLDILKTKQELTCAQAHTHTHTHTHSHKKAGMYLIKGNRFFLVLLLVSTNLVRTRQTFYNVFKNTKSGFGSSLSVC